MTENGPLGITDPLKLKTIQGGHLASLVTGAHERAPYICAQVSIPCRAGILARHIPGAHERMPYIKKKTPRTSIAYAR